MLRCRVEDLLFYEQRIIDAYDASSRNGYNIRPRAESNAGHVWSEESRAKLAEVKRGKKRASFSEEWRQKIAAAGLGRKVLVGYKHTDEARTNMRARPPLSTEARAKISAALKGKPRPRQKPVSEETRRKMSERMRGNSHAKGVQHTAETRAKVSAALKGIKRSPETRARMAASALAREARKRGGDGLDR